MKTNFSKNTVTVLLPGSFKPLHAGHTELIRRYSEHPIVKEVRVLVGPGIRNGIDQSIATQITGALISIFDNVVVEPVSYPTPILTAYKYVANASPGLYAMGGVKKNNDYKRVIDFVNQHAIGGKYQKELPKGVEVIELGVNTSPVLYSGRGDVHDTQPISASILRADVANGDYNKFKTNYPGYNTNIIKEVWDILCPILNTQTHEK